jgi:hypothetical protein
MSDGEATDAARRAAAPEAAAARPERPRYGELAPTHEETDAAASANSDSDEGAGAASSER